VLVRVAAEESPVEVQGDRDGTPGPRQLHPRLARMEPPMADGVR
jgi:hypothetical protein